MVYDYDGILTELKNKLSLLSNWATTQFHGTYERLLSAIAYGINNLIYVAEFLYRESNWVLAQKISSLMPRTKFLSYRAHRKKGASGELSMSASSTFSASYTYTGESVIIPQWTQFTDINNVLNVYTTATKTYYKNTTGNTTLDVKEGIPKEFLYIAEGTANETIYLYSDSIDEDEIYVYIVDANNNILETVKRCKVDEINSVTIDYLYFLTDNTTYYYCEIENSAEFNYVTIKVGDGVATKKFNAGDRILIKYAETQGDLGNIETSNLITKCKTTLTDALGNIATLYFTNNAAISDGNAIEDIESIRNNASNLFSTGLVCNGYDNWKYLLEANSLIHKAIIWSTDDEADDSITSLQNKVYVTAVSASGDALTSAQQDDITVNYLKPIKSPTEIVTWQTLKKLYAIFRVTATVTNTPFPTIESKTNDALEAAYGVLNTEFKANVNESNFVAIIDNLDEIVYHESNVYNMDKINLASFSNYTLIPSYTSTQTSTLADQVYLVPDTLEIWGRIYSGSIWQDPIKIGHDTSGAIIADNGFTLTNKSLLYVYNQVSCTIVDYVGLTAGTIEVVLIYKTKDGNGNKTNDVRLPTFDLITDVDSAYNTFNLSYQ